MERFVGNVGGARRRRRRANSSLTTDRGRYRRRRKKKRSRSSGFDSGNISISPFQVHQRKTEQKKRTRKTKDGRTRLRLDGPVWFRATTKNKRRPKEKNEERGKENKLLLTSGPTSRIDQLLSRCHSRFEKKIDLLIRSSWFEYVFLAKIILRRSGSARGQPLLI